MSGRVWGCWRGAGRSHLLPAQGRITAVASRRSEHRRWRWAPITTGSPAPTNLYTLVSLPPQLSETVQITYSSFSVTAQRRVLAAAKHREAAVQLPVVSVAIATARGNPSHLGRILHSCQNTKPDENKVCTYATEPYMLRASESLREARKAKLAS